MHTEGDISEVPAKRMLNTSTRKTLSELLYPQHEVQISERSREGYRATSKACDRVVSSAGKYI